MLILASCGSPKEEGRPDDSERGAAPELAVDEAAKSSSLVFPLFYRENDNPKGFTKVVGSMDSMGENAPPGSEHQAFVSALLKCSPGAAWYVATGNWYAIVMPSEDSASWSSVDHGPPADDEIIECVRENTSVTFFYRKADSGTQTWRLRSADDPSRDVF